MGCDVGCEDGCGGAVLVLLLLDDEAMGSLVGCDEGG